jgi:alanyl-tRNA synthetase
MKTSEIRSTFLEYFSERDHRIVSSSPLVPGNDPTLLFTNAGMVQFKDVFLGHDKRDYSRAVTSQRCVRAGGKHNDLENVGYTARHHTFFEMLGNFSFGDYFKREAIHFAWDFLTSTIGLPKDKLWITVFEKDDEAAKIWANDIGVNPDRIARIGAKDNFWSMGDTGPCGPCTEIFYDHGPEVAGGPPGTPDEDGDRFIEIWNLVFMQFNRMADGTMVPLPKPSVDTGMGLERLAAILQGKHNNYEIDLFSNLIDTASNLLNQSDRENKSLRVIADHIRSTAFMITDGVTPSNEGRGYVLRRIIRRAIRHGYQLGTRDPFFHGLVGTLDAEMGVAFPELRKARTIVENTLKAEEERFFETLDQGIRILDQEISTLSGKELSGETVFKLYDTFGFPADLTNDVAREHGLSIDEIGFQAAMNAQRERARTASKFVMGDMLVVPNAHKTEFCGYDSPNTVSKVIALFVGDRPVNSLKDQTDGVIVLDKTSFYAESGGQIGDSGSIAVDEGVFSVTETRYLANKVIGHFGKMISGEISIDDAIDVSVDSTLRARTANNHSVTHLLHEALRQILGDHVQQKGSLVEDSRLRFDFSNFKPVSTEQLQKIESLVNEKIRANLSVTTRLMDLDDARDAGAAALFGEKYEDIVRVVQMEDFSLELCGGTHVARTGDIGLFKICTETGVASGVRRIEAVTGVYAEQWMNNQILVLSGLSNRFKLPAEKLEEKFGELAKSNRSLEEQVRQLQAKLATSVPATENFNNVPTINGVNIVVERHNGIDAKGMRTLIDQLRERYSLAVLLIAGEVDGRALFIAGTVGKVESVHAGSIIQRVSVFVDGKGGGRADMAQGGGPRTENIDKALDEGKNLIMEQLNNNI